MISSATAMKELLPVGAGGVGAPSVPVGAKRRRRKKDPNAPKRPKSAYMCFLVENRARIVAEHNINYSKVTEVAKAIGNAWKELSPQERAKYEKMSFDDKERYKVATADYHKNNPIIKKPISAYMYFVRDMRPQLRAKYPDKNFAELGKLLGTSWKAISKVDKDAYNQKAERDKVRYVKEIANVPQQETGKDKKVGQRGRGNADSRGGTSQSSMAQRI